MKRKITLKQIARELNVSISTVSKALRDNHEISKETADKIKAFAKQNNYRPNNIALSLKNRKSMTIGVIIPDITHHFFSKVIKGIEKIANKQGFNVIIGLSNDSFDKEVLNMEMLANGSIDGFIISISNDTQLKQDYHHLAETMNQGMPIVMFDRFSNETICDKVIVDDFDGGRKATKKLLEIGCKHIAIISTEDFVSVSRHRLQGYLEALDNHKITPKSSLITKISEGADIEKEVNQLFDSNKKIDGVFAVNEIFAITAMKVARQRGLRVPEDISVIGFSDGLLSKHCSPSLTTISQHAVKMGEKSAELLMKRLENESEEEELPRTIVIETSLIERESTR